MVTYRYDSLVDNEHSQFSTTASTITQNDITTSFPPPIRIPSWDDPYIAVYALSHCLAKQANIIYINNIIRTFVTRLLHTCYNAYQAKYEFGFIRVNVENEDSYIG